MLTSTSGFQGLLLSFSILLGSTSYCIANNIPEVLTVSSNKEPSVILEDIKVLGDSRPDQIEKESIEKYLNSIPGGSNLIDLNSSKPNQSSIANVLNYEPGIVVQEFFGGNDQPRINIRGSGIQDNPVNRGIQLLFNGMPLNQADGSFIIGLLDPEQARFISILRGSNAMRYGATTLGGAIHFHPRMPSNSKSSGELSTGSFGYQNYKLNYYPSSKIWDRSIQMSHSEQTGFRPQSDGKRSNFLLGNELTLGNIKNNIHIHYVNNRFDIPFLLTKDVSENKPNSVIGDGDSPMDDLLNVRIRKPFRHSVQHRASTTFELADTFGKKQLGVYADKTTDQFRNPLTETETNAINYGLEFSWQQLFTHENYLSTDTVVFLSWNTGEMPRKFQSVNPINGDLLDPFADVNLASNNLVFGLKATHDLSLNWKLDLSVQYAKNQRIITDQLNSGVLDSDFKYSTVNPKFGLIFTPEISQRYYANVSASSEPPNFWQLSTVAANPHDPLNDYLFINDLKLQTADTFELGFQQSSDKIKSQFSYYYSQVSDELISVVGDFAVNGKTINYDGVASHQGVELGLDTVTPLNIMKGDQFTSKLIYNYSLFRFDTGTYRGNHIAGVPEHLIQIRLGYRPSRNLQLQSSFRWQPAATWTDHMNTKSQRQDPFLLVGLHASYQPHSQLSTYIDFNNITDEQYQTAYVVRGQSASDLPTFIPGAGFHIKSGVRYQW